MDGGAGDVVALILPWSHLAFPYGLKKRQGCALSAVRPADQGVDGGEVGRVFLGMEHGHVGDGGHGEVLGEKFEPGLEHAAVAGRLGQFLLVEGGELPPAAALVLHADDQLRAVQGHGLLVAEDVGAGEVALDLAGAAFQRVAHAGLEAAGGGLLDEEVGVQPCEGALLVGEGAFVLGGKVATGILRVADPELRECGRLLHQPVAEFMEPEAAGFGVAADHLRSCVQAEVGLANDGILFVEEAEALVGIERIEWGALGGVGGAGLLHGGEQGRLDAPVFAAHGPQERGAAGLLDDQRHGCLSVQVIEGDDEILRDLPAEGLEGREMAADDAFLQPEIPLAVAILAVPPQVFLLGGAEERHGGGRALVDRVNHAAAARQRAGAHGGVEGGADVPGLGARRGEVERVRPGVAPGKVEDGGVEVADVLEDAGREGQPEPDVLAACAAGEAEIGGLVGVAKEPDGRGLVADEVAFAHRRLPVEGQEHGGQRGVDVFAARLEAGADGGDLALGERGQPVGVPLEGEGRVETAEVILPVQLSEQAVEGGDVGGTGVHGGLEQHGLAGAAAVDVHTEATVGRGEERGRDGGSERRGESLFSTYPHSLILGKSPGDERAVAHHQIDKDGAGLRQHGGERGGDGERGEELLLAEIAGVGGGVEHVLEVGAVELLALGGVGGFGCGCGHDGCGLVKG